jgi:hypothetical protein
MKKIYSIAVILTAFIIVSCTDIGDPTLNTNSNSVSVGDEVTLSLNGLEDYDYLYWAFYYVDGTEDIFINHEDDGKYMNVVSGDIFAEKTKSVTFKPTKTGTYKVKVDVGIDKRNGDDIKSTNEVSIEVN